MKIMIMSCSDKSFWYAKQIGKIFEVKRQDGKRYYVKGKDRKVLIPIQKNDCEIIQV